MKEMIVHQEISMRTDSLEGTILLKAPIVALAYMVMLKCIPEDNLYKYVSGWEEIGHDPTREDIIQLPKGLTIEVTLTIVRDYSEDEE